MKAARKLQSLTVLCVLGATSATSNQVIGGESLDRFGRLLGVGWSDGYHACSDDCYQLGENLPPRSYAADHALYAPRAATVSHVHASQSNGGCTTCNPSRQPSMSHEYDAPAQAYSPYTDPERQSIAPPILDQPAMPEVIEPEARDESLLDLENPASPSDQLQAPEKRVAPPKSDVPPTQAAPAPTPKVPAPKIPMPMDSDDDLLLDEPEDSDGLIDELPPPARDPLSPENSTFYPRSTRHRVAPVARTSAEVPMSRPIRIGAREPQRLPMTR